MKKPWTLSILVAICLVCSFIVVSCGDDDEDEVSEGDKEACREDCSCKYEEICLEGCALWATGDSFLYLGCSGDCDFELSECRSECSEDGSNSWNGTGPFGADWYDWDDLINQSNC